jgi:hypothetical protein
MGIIKSRTLDEYIFTSQKLTFPLDIIKPFANLINYYLNHSLTFPMGIIKLMQPIS